MSQALLLKRAWQWRDRASIYRHETPPVATNAYRRTFSGDAYFTLELSSTPMTRTEITIAVGTALLSFLGALAGVYVASRLDQSNWTERFNWEQKRVVLEKRVALLERATVILNKAMIITGLRASIDMEANIAQIAATCAAKKANHKPLPQGCSPPPKANPERVEAIGKEIHVLNAELAATMTLCATYFGEETRNAIRVLTKDDPWTASDKARAAVIDALAHELNAFPL